jgi:hypothetical protein
MNDVEVIDSGQRFGRLVATGARERRGSGRAAVWYGLYKCDCGAEKWIKEYHVRTGATASCGCRVANAALTRERMVGGWVGRLMVRAISRADGKWVADCLCNCGNSAVVRVDHLQSGATGSCGCLRDEMKSQRTRTHGDSKSNLYNRYRSIVQRCSDPKTIGYLRYGGRGIQNRFGSYSAFKEWALQSGYRRELTIDRIDVNGHYEPANCRWIPLSEQAANTRSVIRITWQGETMHASAWARRLGCSYSAVLRRYRANKPIDQPMKAAAR